MKRLISLFSVLCLELFIQGALLYGLEDTLHGKSDITQGYFNVYKSKYFGYTIVSLAIGYCLELSLLILYSMHGKMRCFGIYTAGVLIIVITAGAVIGIIYFTVRVCANWSGYWSISFIWGALIEVFIIETTTMLVRFCIVKN